MIQGIIVISYVILTILIGIWSKKKTRSSKNYDGVALSLIICVAAGAGEWLGGTATTGVSEYGYVYGLSGAWYTIANGIGICFLAMFFSKMFRKLNTPTVSGIIGKYIGQRARALSGVMMIMVMVMVGVSQMVSLGILGEALLGLNTTWSIIILGMSVLVYTVFGGMQAVGCTNIMHMLIIYAGGIVALLLCVNTIGWNEMQKELPQAYFSMDSIGWNKITSWMLASVLGACTAQAGLQPILGAKDEKTAEKSSYLIAIIVAPFGLIMALLGMFAKVQFPELSNAKMALPMLLMSMSPVIGGIVIASIFAAILSTASPIFLACGTLFTRDIYMLREKNRDDKSILFISRNATFVSGCCCILTAILIKNATTILDLVYFAYSIRGAIFIVLLLGIFWKRTSSGGAVMGMMMTGVISLVWVIYKSRFGYYPIHPQLSETYIALIVAFIVTIIGSLLSKEKMRETRKSRIRIMRKSVVEYVSEYATVHRDKIAVIDSGNELTYGDLFRLVCGYSKYLKETGVSKGDIVVVRASQSIDFIVIYLAVHLSGGVVASLEKDISDEGLLSVAKQLSASVVLTDNEALGSMYHAIYVKRNNIVEVANNQDISDYTCSFPSEDDSADILFTTGTTGSSKGVELSHRALVATAENLIYGCGYKPDTLLIVPGPLNHANAIRKVFTTFVNGSTVYLLNGMTNIKEFFHALDYPIGTKACCLPPVSIRVLFQITQDKIGDYADTIDFIETATAPLPEPDKQRLCSLLPNTRLYNNYGSSEAASVCMYDYNKYPGLVGCVGKAMPNSQVIIVDEDKKVIISSKNRMGFLACIGDVNMKGYINEPLLTKEVLVDSIVYTNDLGYIDENGFVFVSGRKGDVINVGGLKVAPTEVEAAALAYEGIEDCICIPVEDRISGNALKLLVVCGGGYELNIKDFRNFMVSKLEKYKVPHYYEQVNRIERTYNGKLNRKAYISK